MKDKKKIGLFGIYGLYNYGTEAIVRGTYKLIKLSWPNSEIILYTFLPNQDRKVVEDLNISCMSVPLKKFVFARRLFNKLLRVLNFEYQVQIWDATRVADECDMVFSVGGDIYTIPKHLIEIGREPRHNLLVEFGKEIVKRKPLIIWGASIGPFGNKEKIANYYFNHFKDVSLIICREQITMSYLLNNGIKDNAFLLPDPAFFVVDNIQQKLEVSGKVKVALNLSPLSVRESLGEDYIEFFNSLKRSIIDLLEIPNVDFYLLPHVISPLSDNDNDLIFLKKIFDEIPEEYKNRLTLVSNNNGFLKTKRFLRHCDIVIAARMHCAINAVSEGIPTIILTYSQKGVGMAEYIYDNNKWSVPLLEIEHHLRNRVVMMLSEKRQIKEFLVTRLDEIRSNESLIIEVFRKVLTTENYEDARLID